jgi:hypothetical protein
MSELFMSFIHEEQDWAKEIDSFVKLVFKRIVFPYKKLQFWLQTFKSVGKENPVPPIPLPG